MKAVFVTVLLTITTLVHASLTREVVKELIESRQTRMGQPVSVRILTIEAMASQGASTLYRVNTALGSGEKTYQIRFPLRSRDGVTDVLANTYIGHQDDTAREYKITEGRLALMTQAAADETAEVILREFPGIQLTGIITFAHGERFRTPKAVIFSVQLAYVGMQVVLGRKVYVNRRGLETQVVYED